MGSEAAQRTVGAVWRIESARLVAGLARTVRDVGLAEDLAQDALVGALVQWPSTGVPGNPGAWLTAVARVANHWLSSARSLRSAGSSPERKTPWTKSGSTTTLRMTCCG